MSLEEIAKTVFSEIQQHILKIVVGFVLMGLGWFIGHRRARANWQKREFYDRLNFSLNYIENGTLRLRTLLEKQCEEIFLNKAATDVVLKVAKSATEANPILPLPESDYWYYLNSVLNELSEKYSDGHLKKSQGLPVSTATYLVCLTCESAKDLRMRKIRAMVIQKSLLLALGPNQPLLEKPHHHIRWKTLKTMADEYQKRPWQFLEVELSV
jgi:hypothetical protein